MARTARRCPPAGGLRGLGKRAAALLAGLLLTVPALAVPAPAADAPPPLSPQEMVAAMDRVRNPGRPFRVMDTLVEYVNGKSVDSMVLVVFSKLDEVTHQYDSLVRYQAPARDVGKLVLMDGSKMYFYDPASKASVRLSAQQRLLGQASNGDVITVNFARDYTAKFAGSERIQDADRNARDCWHLDLAASGADAVYSRVEFWLEKETYQVIKGKYYADSGRLLKVAYFRKYREELGGVRPTETIIIDAVDPNQVTTMTFSDYRFHDIPQSWFQRDFLPHLQVD